SFQNLTQLQNPSFIEKTNDCIDYVREKLPPLKNNAAAVDIACWKESSQVNEYYRVLFEQKIKVYGVLGISNCTNSMLTIQHMEDVKYLRIERVTVTAVNVLLSY
ncbi:26288_t:CDS:2, partial [Racocetra persica]